jgi:DNA-binding NarL/FixJ family response regulator
MVKSQVHHSNPGNGSHKKIYFIMISEGSLERNILLVENEPVIRNLLRKNILNHFPLVNIIWANAFQGALLKVERYRPRIAVMEFIYAKQKGSSLVQAIKEADENAFVIVYTDRDYPEYKQSAFQCGADGFVSKITSRSEDVIKLIDRKISESISSILKTKTSRQEKSEWK